MSMKLISSSRTITLPKYAVGGFQEMIIQNFAKNYTLDGSLYVDFYKNRGGWIVTFDAILTSEYNDIRALYNDQFTNEEFLHFTEDDLGLNTFVFLNLPDKRNIDWNKQAVTGLQITLEKRDADS